MQQFNLSGDENSQQSKAEGVSIQQHNPIEVLYQNAHIAVIQTNAGMDLAATHQQQAEQDNDSSGNSNSNNGMSDEVNKHASYGAFNLGLHVNDVAANVLVNRAKLLQRLNQLAQVSCIHWLSQVHSNRVLQTDEQPLSMQLVEADALTSEQVHHALAIMTADCVPVCLWQQNTHKIAAIHAGWQGLANGVIANTLAQFDQQQGAIHAMIGACISQDSYEVSQQVVEKMAATIHGDIQPFVQAHATHADKAWLNLPAIAAAQLQQAGISSEHINQGYADKAAYRCSYQDTHYYSYRRMTHKKLAQTGRMAMLIVRCQ